MSIGQCLISITFYVLLGFSSLMLPSRVFLCSLLVLPSSTWLLYGTNRGSLLANDPQSPWLASHKSPALHGPPIRLCLRLLDPNRLPLGPPPSARPIYPLMHHLGHNGIFHTCQRGERECKVRRRVSRCCRSFPAWTGVFELGD